MIDSRTKKLFLKKINKFNKYLILNAVIIVAISISTIYSATISKGASFYIKESLWGLIGVVAFFVVSFTDYKKYMKIYKLIYVGNILLLLSVLVVGTTKLGAKRWISLGPINIQPGEIGKVLVVITLCAYLTSRKNERSMGLKSMLLSGLHIAPVVLLILKQPDLGTSLIIILSCSIILFMNNLDFKIIIVMILSACAFVPFAYFFLLKDYQRVRIVTFLSPEKDLLGSGWNVTQSMIAIGSGKIYGKGFLKSTQSKLKFLPEAHTDFIASVFLEERGFLGGLVLFALYILLIGQILYIADTTEDRFGKLVAYGIGSIFFFHFVVNVGMTMGIMPVTGKPLLFMSYGGTSLLISFVMLGIVQSIRIHRD